MTVKSNAEIAREAKILPIAEVATKVGISPRGLLNYGPYKAKVTFELINALRNRPDGKLILVTRLGGASTWEGNTATTIALGDGLNRIGVRAISCLREPSLSDRFGTNGDSMGGGYSQVLPMDDVFLHFTGDFHAVTAANNLLAALVDNHIYWGNELDIDPRRIIWRRVLDVDDRALRNIVCALGGIDSGFPREDHFDVTAASEVMAVLCLSLNLEDLERRLGNIVVAYTRTETPVYARDLHAHGAMAALLKNALLPNLVQTLENNPVFIHGGPCADVSHGCNSALSTKTALKLADFVVTQSGLGADLGAEKFFDIKCRQTGLAPSAAVIVATTRTLKLLGGIDDDGLSGENVAAVAKGSSDLERQIANIRKFGVEPVVAVNKLATDTQDELDAVIACAKREGTEAFLCTHRADGSHGIASLARYIVETCKSAPTGFRNLYGDDLPLWYKAHTVATELFSATGIGAEAGVVAKFKGLQEAGYGHLPICMAMSQISTSTRCSTSGRTIEVSEVILAAGAEYIVVVCGESPRVPGLPRTPLANRIRLDHLGRTEGLF